MAQFISQVAMSLTQMVLLHYLDKTVKLAQVMTVRLNQMVHLFQTQMEALRSLAVVQFKRLEELLIFLKVLLLTQMVQFIFQTVK
ncbi:hypothetical protein [Lactococcus lactis]|uniref:hypothetical protein n=1 Tax=Lactococcus lactis TaxID=1358 RepID=UPI001396B18E|nr:hypothetical protein [Lactococcus lactis]